MLHTFAVCTTGRQCVSAKKLCWIPHGFRPLSLLSRCVHGCVYATDQNPLRTINYKQFVYCGYFPLCFYFLMKQKHNGRSPECLCFCCHLIYFWFLFSVIICTISVFIKFQKLLFIISLLFRLLLHLVFVYVCVSAFAQSNFLTFNGVAIKVVF